MEVEEQATPPVEEKTLESSSTKSKILTLLNPSEGKEAKKDKNKPPTKVVIRRLPPKLTKEAFIEEFSPLPAHDYFYFVRGDLNLGIHAFSRAYINFSKQEDIFTFKEKYDDYGMTDERGRTYHAVVEFAPFQRVPRRNMLKKKSSKAGTLESDPKYIEFLKKLEEEKNNLTNTSEYFHETEAATVKEKITTTPLLEYLKQKKQKKIDLRNEIRQKKRDAERDRKRKEDERRKAERERRKDDRGDRKSSRYDEKSKSSDSRRSEDKKSEDKDRSKEEKEDLTEKGEGASKTAQSDAVIPNDPAILKVVVRQPEKADDKPSKPSSSKEDVKMADSKPERKYSDFRTRLAEEKQRKTFYKRNTEIARTNRKGMPDEKGDKASIGNNTEPVKKTESATELSKKPIEAKSKFRYSEQRNRDREYRNQKNSDSKKSQEVTKTQGESQENTKKSPGKDFKPKLSENISRSSRRKSLELEREIVDGDRKRSKSLHDSSDNDDRKSGKGKSNNQDENSQPSDGSKDSNGSDEMKKDPRMERRIRNKDRPSIQIYRPGMGKFSKQRLEQKKDDTNNVSPTGTLQNKSKNKKTIKNEESFNKNKTASEVRTMTFTRSTSKEN